ncbi:MAG: iron-containing alcohol dehydrogenase [Clostridiales Family XIII bacterium]|nr:iron-containing alcohol dehydrogenase [Clostridiales Family XIII bacterium]
MKQWNAESLARTFSFVLPTKIIFGTGCIAQIDDVLKDYGCNHPLLITDKGVLSAGVADKVIAALGKDISYEIFDGVEANPKDKNVADAAEAYAKAGADCMIAIGGGSPIDCAKAAGVLIAHGSRDVKEFEGKSGAAKPIPTLICVPTTAGTGSELTFSAVITDTANKYKMTIKTPYTAAKVAVCDPALTLTVPPAVTASTGMDALTHAIEAFTATVSEPIADALALYSMELIFSNLEKAVADGGDLDARSAMLMGSMLGGMAFSHSDVASVHCIAEALGGMYDLPHGVCNAVILPHMMRYCMGYCTEKYGRAAVAFGLPDDNYSDEAKATAAVYGVRELAKSVNLPAFSSLGVSAEDFPVIAAKSAKNISNLSNPRPMTEADYMAVLNIMAEQ